MFSTDLTHTTLSFSGPHPAPAAVVVSLLGFFAGIMEVKKGFEMCSNGGSGQLWRLLRRTLWRSWSVFSRALETPFFNECFSISAHFDPRNVNFHRMSQLFLLFSLLRCAPSRCDTLLSSTGARVSTHFRFGPRCCDSDFLRSHFAS